MYIYIFNYIHILHNCYIIVHLYVYIVCFKHLPSISPYLTIPKHPTAMHGPEVDAVHLGEPDLDPGGEPGLATTIATSRSVPMAELQAEWAKEIVEKWRAYCTLLGDLT